MKQIFADLVSIMGRLGGFERLLIGSVLMIVFHQTILILVSAVGVQITARLVSKDRPQLLLPFPVFFSLATIHALCYLYDAWWSRQLAYQILARIRTDLYAAIQRITPRGLPGRWTGDLTIAAMNDMKQLEWFHTHTTPIAVVVLVNTVIIEPVLITLIGLPVLPVLIPMVLPIPIPWLLAPIQRK